MQGLQFKRHLPVSSTWKYAGNGTGSPDIFNEGISLCRLECIIGMVVPGADPGFRRGVSYRNLGYKIGVIRMFMTFHCACK